MLAGSETLDGISHRVRNRSSGEYQQPIFGLRLDAALNHDLMKDPNSPRTANTPNRWRKSLCVSQLSESAKLLMYRNPISRTSEGRE